MITLVQTSKKTPQSHVGNQYKDAFSPWCMLVNAEMPIVGYTAVRK